MHDIGGYSLLDNRARREGKDIEDFREDKILRIGTLIVRINREDKVKYIESRSIVNFGGDNFLENREV